MPKPLTVYGWTGYNRDNVQVREIVAARSVAEALRLSGRSRADWRHSGTTTGNASEIAIALAEPGVIFYTTDRFTYPRTWHKR